jgi:hypothetical protein
MTHATPHTPLSLPTPSSRPGLFPSQVRTRARHALAERPVWTIERVETESARVQLAQLLHDRYLDRGYRSPGLPSPAEDRAPTHVTLGLRQGAAWQATLTVAWGHRGPLSCALRFPEVVRQLEAEGHALCEFMRLAARQEAQGSDGHGNGAPRDAMAPGAGDVEGHEGSIAGLRRLIPLFHAAVRAALAPGCTLALMEVNPRHVGFYRRLAGGRVLAGPRSHEGVGAPAVLMALDLRELLLRLQPD